MVNQPLVLVIWVIFLHFFADWALQNAVNGEKKSSNPWILLRHCLIQGVINGLGMYLWEVIFCPNADHLVSGLLFGSGVFITHLVIDATSWNIYKVFIPKRFPKRSIKELQGKCDRCGAHNFQYWRDYWFGITLAYDQFAHLACNLIVLNYMVIYLNPGIV